MARKTKKRFKFILKIIVASVFIIGASIGGILFKAVYSDNIQTISEDDSYLYIPTGSDFNDVMRIIESKDLLINMSSFKWTAEIMNYNKNIYPGKYKITEDMSNRSLLLMLRQGKAEQVKIMFGKTRGKRQLAKYFADRLEVDYEDMYEMLSDPYYQKDYGMYPRTISAMFIPNTYYFKWNTSAKEVMQRMFSEYLMFWNDKRIAKGKKYGLSKVEIITLASIVEEETYMNDEKPIVAAVYLNRLKKGMKLQADPTVRFAVGDFSLKRVLKKHLRVDSPYNTYKYKGLPPGPICIPSIKSIDAVLNAASHDYLYFCARPDFSGYHDFSENYAQHMKYARSYQKRLSEEIKKGKAAKAAKN